MCIKIHLPRLTPNKVRRLLFLSLRRVRTPLMHTTSSLRLLCLIKYHHSHQRSHSPSNNSSSSITCLLIHSFKTHLHLLHHLSLKHHRRRLSSCPNLLLHLIQAQPKLSLSRSTSKTGLLSNRRGHSPVEATQHTRLHHQATNLQ